MNKKNDGSIIVLNEPTPNQTMAQWFVSSNSKIRRVRAPVCARQTMKLTPPRGRLSSILQPVLFHSNPGRPVSCSRVSSSHKPRIPLHLRPLTFSATVADLKKWHIWAKNLVSSVGSTFLNLDNGPDSTLLQRELTWLIQDAFENPNKVSSQSSNDNDDSVVSLRTCLDNLYKMWKQRIEERRPFQYIVGCEHWRDLVLSVEEGVLIPRPETEMIVDLVNDALKENEELRDGLWADLGTGSGAIAIGIGRILGDHGKVIAADLSPIAVSVASYNVQRYNLQEKIAVKQGSWFEPLKNVEGGLAGLVSNPPYIPSDHIGGLQAEVAKHEPRLALDGGPHGMNDLLHLCNGAVSMLKPGGFVALETNGETHSKFLVDHMDTETKGCFHNVKIISDFAGVQRFVTGYRAR